MQGEKLNGGAGDAHVHGAGLDGDLLCLSDGVAGCGVGVLDVAVVVVVAGEDERWLDLGEDLLGEVAVDDGLVLDALLYWELLVGLALLAAGLDLWVSVEGHVGEQDARVWVCLSRPVVEELSWDVRDVGVGSV